LSIKVNEDLSGGSPLYLQQGSMVFLKKPNFTKILHTTIKNENQNLTISCKKNKKEGGG